jgi:type I restriction enzyme S subunit
MSFPMVVLGEVIKHRNQFIQIDDLENYKRCRVQLHAQGIVLRDIVLGAEIKTKKQQVCRTGDFLVAEIDAKVGGFGIVPPELHDSIVSSHYFLFVIDETRLDRRFLDFFIRTPYFREQVTAQGTTNYAAIRPANVLGYKIPFLPLPEQRRIVARIEELAAKIEEARRLRKTAEKEVGALLSSALHRQFNSAQTADLPKQPIVTLSTIFRGRSPVYQEGSGKLAINQKCVRWNGIDIVHAKEVSEGWIQSLPSNSFLQENDILVNSTGEGTIGRACILTQNAIGFPFDSHVLVVRVEKERVLPTLMTYYLRSPCGQGAIEDSKGAKTTKQTELGTTKLGEIIVPLPPLPEQRRIVAYLDELQAKVDALRHLQAETGAELDALMPAVLDRAFKGELALS